ncbi:MAG: hypothetical protein PHE33_08735, partial [Bacteroidales bacterium]|nr:hypothetical protein [Bacteroidales bacterium]
MKKIIFILVAVVIASMSFGQNSFIDKKSKTNFKTSALTSNKPFKESSTNKTFAKSTKEVGATIFSSNFSNPAQWTIDNEAGNSDNWVIGTTGPSIPSYMLPIESTTAANGFALFDSDFLCSGNQNANLTTAASFDCSEYPTVHLKFETFYKKHQENGIFVQVSNNGTDWSNFQIFAEYTQGNQSENPTTLDIDISSAASNEATVWIRFKYLSISNGCDYAWMIDDVIVYEAVETISTFPFIETFEDDSPTRGTWTQIQEAGTGSWTFATGAGSGSITSAYEGNLNAKFTASDNNNITKLVSPLMDLTELTNPQLVFWYGQGNWGTQNELKIYYKTDATGSWVEFAHYTDDVNVWTKELLSLPSPSSTYQIAFEGIDNYGFANVLDNITVRETATNIVYWCNLQQPGTATILNTETFDAYAQVWEDGVTDADAYAAGTGIECWIGYSDTNTNPSTWTNWIAATYNQDVEVKDEFIATLGTFNSGTYYYASRFRYQEGPYSYGGYTSTGGGEWNGTTNVSGVLTVNSTLGGDCSNPFVVNIPADLPYADLAQTNCGLGYNYNNTSISDPNYDDGEDAIYQLILTSDAIIRIALNPKTTLYTSISLFNDCPDTGILLDEFYDSYNIWREIEISLPAGTYYVMIDTWASPDCIPDYDLMIEAVCITPSGIEEINLTQTSTDLQWTAGNLETSWNIKVNESNPIDPSFELGNIVANAEVFDNPTFSIETGLTLDTDYYVYVKAACGYEWVTYMFTTPTACPVPTGLTATVINANNATLTWNKLGMSEWIIKVSTTSLSDPENETADIENNTDITGGIAQYNLSNLSIDIFYYWYVKSACGSDWSAENVFTTACDPSLIPFMEDFTGVLDGEIPNCWDKSHENWSVKETSHTDGTFPELEFNWAPEIIGDIAMFFPIIDATANFNL